MKNFIVAFILVLAVFSGCSDDERGIKTMADLNVVIESGDTYKFVVTTGNEEDAAIIKQPTHNFVVSEFKKDSATTNGIYTFTPDSGFIGVEEIQIEKRTYTFDTEPQINKALIKIKITVEKGFP